MSHSQWLTHTILSLVSLSCLLDACSFCSHSQPREALGAALGAAHSPHIVPLHRADRPSQHLVRLALAQATGVTAQRSCFFSTFFLQLSTNAWLSYTELSWNALGVAFMSLNGKPEAQWEGE